MEESSDIVNLLSIVSEVQKKFSVCPERDFNVFRLCGVDHYELWHSKIIAHFLSPQGTHGFKGKFLRTFAQGFGLGEYSDSAIVRTEVSSRTGEMNFGRFDILIEDEETENICIIENKIFAAEQPRQLERYNAWLNQMKAIGRTTYLVFLTLNGRDAESSYEGGYKRISYLSEEKGNSLFTWVDRCAEIAKEIPCVREALCQYRDHIKKISTGGDAMNREIKQELACSMHAAELVYRNYQSACLSMANQILCVDVLEELKKMCGGEWRCETGLSFTRRESGVLYIPPEEPSSKGLKGQLYIVFEETGLLHCQVALYQDVNKSGGICNDDAFKNAIGDAFPERDGWRKTGKSVDVKDPWPIWCPILTGNKVRDCQNGIDWNGEFFDKYSKDSKFRNRLLEEIVAKIGQLYKLQLVIS